MLIVRLRVLPPLSTVCNSLTHDRTMMRLLNVVLLSAVCSLVNSQSKSLCEFDLDDIKSCISMSEEGVTHFILNCLAAHNGSFAESISLSAFTGEGDGMRYDFQCYEGTTLIRTVSANISNLAHHACASCQFNLSDPCVGGELTRPCQAQLIIRVSQTLDWITELD